MNFLPFFIWESLASLSGAREELLSIKTHCGASDAANWSLVRCTLVALKVGGLRAVRWKFLIAPVGMEADWVTLTGIRKRKIAPKKLFYKIYIFFSFSNALVRVFFEGHFWPSSSNEISMLL